MTSNEKFLVAAIFCCSLFLSNISAQTPQKESVKAEPDQQVLNHIKNVVAGLFGIVENPDDRDKRDENISKMAGSITAFVLAATRDMTHLSMYNTRVLGHITKKHFKLALSDSPPIPDEITTKISQLMSQAAIWWISNTNAKTCFDARFHTLQEKVHLGVKHILINTNPTL